jgi:hypothetical protein
VCKSKPAGAQGFQIRVKGNTDLQGALIRSLTRHPYQKLEIEVFLSPMLLMLNFR